MSYQDECDLCGRHYNYAERHVAVLRRPSDPTELCSVMACCPECANHNDWPTPADLEHQYNNAPQVFAKMYGDGILWLSL